jgi:tetratricopeptide (TPR) repeat protein
MLAACSATHRASTLQRLPASAGFNASTLDVPFIVQKPNYCGPAALAMMARFYGHDVTQDEIAGAIYLPEIRGTLTADLAGYAERFDLWTRQYRGSRADLRQKLSAGVPIIVLGKLGANYHYFVALDDRDGELVVHSDTRPLMRLREDDFLRWWDRADRWTLLVCPPDRARWRLSADEHNDLGVFLERTGNLSAAAGNYRRAAELQPSNSYFQMNLGNALLKQRQYREAIVAYNNAVQAAPDNADAWNNLAYVYAEEGANLNEAAAACERAIKLNPSRRASYLDTLGAVRLRQGDAQAAIAALESALAAAADRDAALREMIRQRLATARALLKE